MRARQRRFTTRSTDQSVPARSPSRGRVGGALKFVHLLMAFSLISGMISPFISATAAVAAPVPNERLGMTLLTAQEPNTPPPLPRPNTVVVGGDFQDQLGCQNFDKNCDATQLQANDDGTWTGAFQIAPGDYSFNIIVRTDDGDVALGRDGQAKPEADDNSVSVPNGAIGVFFSYNRLTGEVIAAPYSNQVEVQIDGGQALLLTPSPDGGWDAYLDIGPGTHSGQLIVDGQPFGDPFDVNGGQTGRVHVVVDGNGTVQSFDTIETATLQVTKSDGDGNVLPGSCFSVYSRNGVAGQECDVSDGEDGVTTIPFPNGVPSGNLTIAESKVPDGQPEFENQRIRLQAGDNQFDAVVGGGQPQTDETPTEEVPPGETPTEEVPPDETPTEQTTQGVEVSFLAYDSESGESLGGACYTVDGGDEQCDDDQDGVVTFSGIAPGQHTLTETVDPDGYTGIGSTDFTVDEAGGQFQVPHTASQPKQPETGNFAVHVRDGDDNPLPGACFTLTPGRSVAGQETHVCDGDDGSDDGEVLFSDLAAGRWRLTEDTIPDGFRGGNARNIDVPAGETGEVTIVNRAAGPATGTITATTVDDSGAELPDVCYEITGFDQQCDGNDDDNVMTQEDVAPGDYTVTLVVPDGYEVVGDAARQVTVQAGETAAVQFTVQQAQAAEGTLAIHVRDGDNNRLDGACFNVQGPASGDVCDDDDDGELSFQVPPGDYTISQTQTKDGYDPDEDKTATVPGGGTGEVTFVNQLQVTPTPEPPATGSLHVTIQDDGGAPIAGACVDYAGPSSGSVCDGDGNDGDPADGAILIADLEPGDYSVDLQQVDGFQAAQQETATVNAGEQAEVTLSAAPEPTTGNLIITKQDPEGNLLSGACFTVDNGTEICDNGTGDTDPTGGIIKIEGIAAGRPVLRETVPPDGHEANRPRVRVDIVAGQDNAVTVVNNPLATPTPTPVPTGILVANTSDQEGNPVGGACYEVTNYGQVCDQDGDGDMTLDDAPEGEYTVQQVSVPQGYDLADPASQQATVTAGETIEVDFVSNLQNGSIVITKTDGQNPLGGACFTVDDGNEICDNGNDDTDPTDGTIAIVDVQPGQHQVAESQAPDGYDLDSETKTVDVQAGQPAQVTFVNTLQTSSLSIVVTDGAQDIEGACVSVDGGDPVCDNQDGDNDPAPGVIEITGLTPGEHTIVLSQAIDGFELPGEQTVTVPPGGQESVTFQLQPLPTPTEEPTEEPTATETPTEEPTLEPTATETPTEEPTLEPTATETATEEPTATETPTEEPTDEPTATETATEEPTEEPTATETPTEEAPAPGSLHIAKVDDAGDPLGGACFSIDGPQSYSACDDGDGDTDGDAGSIVVENVAAGLYTITETTAPKGYIAGDSAEIEVVSGEQADVEITNAAEPEPTPQPTEEPETGGIAISLSNENGDSLPGGCFAVSGPTDAGPVCDNTDGDANTTDEGVVLILGLAEGDYDVTQTGAPTGYSAAAGQPASVTAGGEPTPVAFVNEPTPPETGDVRISSTAQDGATAGGGCYTVGAIAACDNGDNDADPAPGAILVKGLIVGDYDVTETDAPEGYLQNTDVQQVTVEADQEAGPVEFIHDPVPVQTGGVTFDLKDPDGNPVVGGCVRISSNSNAEGGTEYCDGGPEDQDPADGVLALELETGSYSARQSELPAPAESASTGATNAMANFLQADALAGLPEGLSLDEKTFTIKVNVVIIVIIIIIIILPDDGDLVIIKRAEDTNQLQGGACFQVDGPGGNPEICDNDGADGNGTAGIIRFDDLAFGDYDVTETQAPAGYDAAPNTTVTIDPGVTTITIKDPPTTDTTGNLVINKVDENGDKLEGACFELRQSNVVIYPAVCDDDDGDSDGVIHWNDIDPGTYKARETVLPTADYVQPPDQNVKVEVGITKTYNVVNHLKPGNILIVKLDDQGHGPIPGACFALERGGNIEYEICDQAPNDGDFEEGIIYFKDIPAGDWNLIETQAPPTFQPGDDQTVTVLPGDTLHLDIENEKAPVTPKGNLKVFKVDQYNDPLPGACFSLKQGNATIVPPRCDSADGSNDGTITFPGVAAGNYKLHETKKPSASYQTVADVNVTVVANTTKIVKVTNVLKPGRILVKKVNQQNQPLQGACFDLSPDGAGAKCTDANGFVSFDNLDPTVVYKLTETKAAPGYLLAPPKTNIAVQAGLTTQVTVVDKKAPPPDNSGSIKVIKFFCPAGKGGELTTVYDSSDAGPKKLAQTANCKKGDAYFDLQKKGSKDVFSFHTGVDGEFQATFPSGNYTLTEQKTDITWDIVIYTNQQTTVVVLNFVKPPQPKPATIRVIKYTCDAGFEGSYYADFANNCVDPANLTNGVTFRVSGGAAQKRVTGDDLKKGETTFTQLPAGAYTLEEEPPLGATTVYGFCGYDIDNPDYKTVDEDISFNLNDGDALTCTFFNIPDDLSDSTGAIKVTKYVCDFAGNKRPADFDWFGECSVETDGVKFALSAQQGGLFVPKATGITNADGIIRFSQLKPGTYQLKEVGAEWCHAESDNVNPKGDLIVKAGQRTNVWIFNCVPTKSPPNTGAGTTAPPEAAQLLSAPALVGGLDPVNSGEFLLLAIWPLLGLAFYSWRRTSRRPARRAV